MVPKDGGKDFCLIFHLSYPRGKSPPISVNANIPKEKCSVAYPDFCEAIQMCLHEGAGCHISKSDMTSAFRNLGMSRSSWRYLILKAESPIDGHTYYFIDKCMPFGASISCSHFQRFSNAVAHIVQFRTGRTLVNYLDDNLFAAYLRWLCNQQMRIFIEVCESIGFPISADKTYWATTILQFLGLLIDTVNQLVLIPIEKVCKAHNMISQVVHSKSGKITLLQLHKICGFLNFLGKCVVPGRAFTRCLYSFATTKANNKKLLLHHHVRVTKEMKLDLEMWLCFINQPSVYWRPFIDFEADSQSEQLPFYTDASGKIGFGGLCQLD